MADTKQQAPDLPVYLFTGFLEAGKTKFIQETLEDNRFHKGERTLLLLCEEGEEGYEPDKFCAGNVYVRNIDEESDLTVSHLKALQDEIRPERVLVEYNGCSTHSTATCRRAGRSRRNSCFATRRRF